MKFCLALLVASVGTVQSELNFGNFSNYTLGDNVCTFNFTDLDTSDEVICTQDIDAPNTVSVTVSGGLTGGNCTDMNISAPTIVSAVSARDTADATKVVSKVQFTEIPVPASQDETSITEFCLKTTVLEGTYPMFYVKTPIAVEFQYDGSFNITAGTSENVAIGDKAGDKTIFTANAFVCSPNFQPNNSPLTIGGILYVCVRPAEDQITTKISVVKFFFLEKVGQVGVFEAVALATTGGYNAKGTNSPVTLVSGEGTRKVVIGVRMPSRFFDSDTNVTGSGEVILGQQRRLLRSDVIVPRDLEDEDEADGAFDLDVKIETRGALSGSVLSNTSSKTSMSMLAVILGALYCFD